MTAPLPEAVLMVGVSTRAFGASALEAGFRVCAVDAFADLDLIGRADVRAFTLEEHGHRYTATRAANFARGGARPVAWSACEAVTYVSNLENHPDAVARLARDRTLWGNAPEVLRRVRDPLALAKALGRLGFPAPAVYAAAPPADGRDWLVKPRRSGGGHGVRRWQGGRVPRAWVIQEYIPGEPGSVSFSADGRRAILVGVARQLVGDRGFGATGFRYCGSLLANRRARLFEQQADLIDRLTTLIAAVTEEFGLVGLNGLDFIARDGVPYPIEINPRFSASMELVERAHEVPMFAEHVSACRGVLPPVSLLQMFSTPLIYGKAIVFARRDVLIGDSRPWFHDADVADVPRGSTAIAAGRPICTVFATAPSGEECYRVLAARAADVYRAAEARVPVAR